jgi:hypothetical protein
MGQDNLEKDSFYLENYYVKQEPKNQTEISPEIMKIVGK